MKEDTPSAIGPTTLSQQPTIVTSSHITSVAPASNLLSLVNTRKRPLTQQPEPLTEPSLELPPVKKKVAKIEHKEIR